MKNLNVRGLAACLLAMTVALPTLAAPAQTASAPIKLTLERAMSYITDDELVEVTPKTIRLRKRWLDPNERKKQERKREAEREAVA